MKVGDLVKLKPEHNNSDWIDIIFLITKEYEHGALVEVCTSDLAVTVPKMFLEVVNG